MNLFIEVVVQIWCLCFIGWLVCYILKLWLWEYSIIRRPVQTYRAKKRISKVLSRPCCLEKKDKAIIEDVERVGRRIEAAAECTKHSIVFLVINDRGIFARACSPNIVLISTGMYRDFRNDDEMAAILGHEVGHIVLCKDKGWVSKSLKESRADEYQADQLGVEFANKAGYKPNAAAQWYWRIMGYRYRMGQDIFTDESSSTHPIELERIRAMNRLLASY